MEERLLDPQRWFVSEAPKAAELHRKAGAKGHDCRSAPAIYEGTGGSEEQAMPYLGGIVTGAIALMLGKRYLGKPLSI
jgi:hypothetical protein